MDKTNAGADGLRDQLAQARVVLQAAGVADFEPLTDGFRRYCTLVEMARNAAATIAGLRAEKRQLQRDNAELRAQLDALVSALEALPDDIQASFETKFMEQAS